MNEASPAVTIRRRCSARANVAKAALDLALLSRMSNDDDVQRRATVPPACNLAHNWPVPDAVAGSRRRATLVALGRDLLQQLEPFAAHAVLEIGNAGDVAARPRQAVDKAQRRPDRRRSRRRSAWSRVAALHMRRPTVAAASDDDVGAERRPVPPRNCAVRSILPSGPAVFDRDVAAVDVQPNCCKALRKRREPSLCFRIVRPTR